MSEPIEELVIIGAGPGGYVTAICAAQRGLKVALIEGREPGGVCLHAGCIPSKAMLASTDLLRLARGATALGIEIPQAQAAWSTLVSRRQKIVQQLAQGVRYLLEKNQVESIRGWGRLLSPTEVEVQDAEGRPVRKFSAPRSIVLATGSRPVDLPGAPRDGACVLNSSDVFELKEVPPELLILGGGYIGCEMATLFSALGSRVTVLEGLARLLPGLDPDLGQFLERWWARKGLQVVLNAQVTAVDTRSGVTATLADGRQFKGSHLLVAAGRVPNVENLGLDGAGVRYSRQGITVNERNGTNVPGIFALGDVTGQMALAHVASAQGRRLVDHLATQPSPSGRDLMPGNSGFVAGAATESHSQTMNYDAIPACVFSHPEIATVGLAEDEARRRGLEIRVGRFPFAANGKAQAMAETEGWVKLIADARTGRLIGGHIVGPHAAELIAAVSLAVQLGATAQQVVETVVAHPTLSEAIGEAAEGLFGQPIHLFTRR